MVPTCEARGASFSRSTAHGFVMFGSLHCVDEHFWTQKPDTLWGRPRNAQNVCQFQSKSTDCIDWELIPGTKTRIISIFSKKTIHYWCHQCPLRSHKARAFQIEPNRALLRWMFNWALSSALPTPALDRVRWSRRDTACKQSGSVKSLNSLPQSSASCLWERWGKRPKKPPGEQWSLFDSLGVKDVDVASLLVPLLFFLSIVKVTSIGGSFECWWLWKEPQKHKRILSRGHLSDARVWGMSVMDILQASQVGNRKWE